MSIENNEIKIGESVSLPGDLLKKAREDKGLSIDEMSAISNLSKQIIRGIESDNYSELAGLSFVRGYLKLYAKKLGINGDEALELFDLWKVEAAGHTSSDSVKRQNRHIDPSNAGGLSRKVMVGFGVVMAALVAAGTFISYQHSGDAVEQKITQSNGAASTDQSIVENPPPNKVESDTTESKTGVAATNTESADLETPVIVDTDSAFGQTFTQSESPPETALNVIPESVSPDFDRQVERPKTESDPKPVQSQIPVEKPKPVEKLNPVVLGKPQSSPQESEPVNEPAEVAPPTNLNQAGRVIAEASGLAQAPIQSIRDTQVSPGEDDGLRVLSETVTGVTNDQIAMGTPGMLEIDFSGESWVEIRDSRGRLILADLMTANNGVKLETYGAVEVLVGAVSVSAIKFNGVKQDLTGKAFQDVARITLGAETN